MPDANARSPATRHGHHDHHRFESLAVFATVVRSPALVRVLLAYLLFSIAELATWVAILVYAFDRGGATASGLVAFAQLAPAVVFAPIGAALGDRIPRTRMLALSYGSYGVLTLLTAVLLFADAPPLARVRRRRPRRPRAHARAPGARRGPAHHRPDAVRADRRERRVGHGGERGDPRRLGRRRVPAGRGRHGRRVPAVGARAPRRRSWRRWRCGPSPWHGDAGASSSPSRGRRPTIGRAGRSAIDGHHVHDGHALPGVTAPAGVHPRDRRRDRA